MVQWFSLGTATRAPTGETTAYVVGDDGGLLVDPAARDPDLDRAVENRVDHVAVTHHHPDHVGAVASYAREFGLTTWALAGRAREFEAATGIEPDRTVAPDGTIPAADGVGVLDTPGHAPAHVAFSVPDGLLTGDLVVSEGSVVVGAPEGDMRAYLSSLRRVHARDPAHLYPGHGPVIDDPRETCARLVAHRLHRERRVLAAVREGNRMPADVVEAAYEKDVSHVFELARATVIAHVEKLAIEGKLDYDGETVRPV